LPAKIPLPDKQKWIENTRKLVADLNAMGLTDRCELRVCQIGEPCIVQVKSTRLGISRSLAGKIMVERM